MKRCMTMLLAMISFGVAAEIAVPTVASGRIERLAQFPSQRIAPRPIDVWLPEGYPEAAPYDVLYMHDGQLLFDAGITWNQQEWRVDEVAGELIASGRVRPFIVVGVHNIDGRRHSEYFPQRPFETLAEAEREKLLAFEREPGRKLLHEAPYSDRHVAFLADDLVPAIESRYAVGKGRAHRFVMGSSMGGLSSLYTLLERQDAFAGAACVSTHWPGAFEREGRPIPEAIFTWLGERLPKPGAVRIYFDYGNKTLDEWYPPLQAEVDSLMRERGWEGKAWVTRFYDGADHSEQSWAARLDQPLLFLFGRESL
jgi:pimeloyl-ACP methyl ester carboxylesterase